MAYARSEEEYDHLYRTLKSSSPPAVVDYFNSIWHDIHAEWIMAIKWSCGNFMNFTNNRADSINGKLKTIVDWCSSLENFARNVFSFVHSTRKEVAHKAATMLQKRQVTSRIDEAHVLYCGFLTPYAYKHVERQLHLASEVAVGWDGGEVAQVITNGKSHTSASDCSCVFRTAMLLPCQHIFAFRHSYGLSKYDQHLCMTGGVQSYTVIN